MPHVVVNNCHPVQYYGIRFLIFLLGVSLLWGAFEMGYMQSEEDIIEARGGRNSLLVQQKILKRQNIELNKELLHLERKYLLEQEASQIIKSNMLNDQQKIAELEKELKFYRGIVSPGNKEQSLYLQSLAIKPVPAMNSKNKNLNDAKDINNLFDYKFVIAQKMRKRTYTKGSVTIYIKGKKGNKPVKLSLFSLLEEKTDKQKKNKTFKFSFKYFQTFEGTIALPDKVVPESVDIIIDTKKKKSIIELNDLAWSQSEGMNYVGK